MKNNKNGPSPVNNASSVKYNETLSIFKIEIGILSKKTAQKML